MVTKMKIISVYNNSGGVAKTTITFHLAQRMVTEGKRVLVVDLDSQLNISTLLLKKKEYASHWENMTLDSQGILSSDANTIFVQWYKKISRTFNVKDYKPIRIAPTENGGYLDLIPGDPPLCSTSPCRHPHTTLPACAPYENCCWRSTEKSSTRNTTLSSLI